MTIASRGISALGKLAFAGLLLGTFVFGLAGVVYMSLSGRELTVPEIVGKDFAESEKELAALGLKIKRRADRPSTEKMNVVLEQLPKAGETVKTGQMILVVVSKAGLEGEDVPSSLKKGIGSDDTEKIEEMITDKPKKPKTNANASRKKAETTRDVTAGSAIDADADVDVDSTEPVSAEGNKNKVSGKSGGAEKSAKPAPAEKPATGKPVDKPATGKPPAAKTGGETRSRAVTKP